MIPVRAVKPRFFVPHWEALRVTCVSFKSPVTEEAGPENLSEHWENSSQAFHLSAVEEDEGSRGLGDNQVLGEW